MIIIMYEYILTLILQHVSPGGHRSATQATVINTSPHPNLGMTRGISARQLHPLEN